MGYREEEKQIQWKLRRIRHILFAVFFFIFVALCVFSAFVPPVTWKYYFSLPVLSPIGEGELRMHFLDVGQGDCTLIEFPDGKKMLVDGGDGQTEHTTTVMRYLNALKIDVIDYLVVTHTDQDHCGGLDTVLRYKTVKTVYYPEEDDVTVNAEYADFFAQLSASSCEKIFHRRNLRIASMDNRYPFDLAFLWPYGADIPSGETEEDANARSAVFWLDYQGNSALFTGDVSRSVEETLLTHDTLGLLPTGVELSSTEWLKVAHHGGDGSTGQAFVEYLHTKSAIISCGLNNAYGHPTAGTLTTLRDAGTEIFRTDTHGTVTVTWWSDGKWATQTQR